MLKTFDASFVTFLMEVVCISLKGETNNYASILMSVRGKLMKHSVSVTCCALLVSSISLSYAAVKFRAATIAGEAGAGAPH